MNGSEKLTSPPNPVLWILLLRLRLNFKDQFEKKHWEKCNQITFHCGQTDDMKLKSNGEGIEDQGSCFSGVGLGSALMWFSFAQCHEQFPFPRWQLASGFTPGVGSREAQCVFCQDWHLIPSWFRWQAVYADPSSPRKHFLNFKSMVHLGNR